MAAGVERPRVPPNQRVVTRWPVLHYGGIPTLDPADWKLHVWGSVEEELLLTWADLMAMPQSEDTSDIHCVTGWSRFDNRWTGVAISDLLELVTLRPEASHVMVHGAPSFTTNLSLADLRHPGVILATHHDGEPLSTPHGGPIRLVVPHRYFWKSAKWLTGLEFTDQDAPGFWEGNGYHLRGDPWTEERYND